MKTLLLCLFALAPSFGHILSPLLGEWHGSGTFRQSPAQATLVWKEILGGKFTELDYVVHVTPAAGPAYSFSGRAVYPNCQKTSTTEPCRARWFDSNGAQYSIEAQFDAQSLTSDWMLKPGEPFGRTKYTIAPDGTLKTSDALWRNGAWSEFAALTYKRR